jgi:hypothetical protein
MVTLDDVRSVALALPRTTEAFVRGRVKFRVGRIVYASFSRDETIMGFGFPKEWREALVESDPARFMLPSQFDMRYNWVHVKLAAIDKAEMQDLVLDAWAMTVPKFELQRVLQLRDPAVFAELDEAIEAVQKPAVVRHRQHRSRVDG